MAISTSLDYHRGPRLTPADLLELYRLREPRHPLLLRGLEVAARLEAPGPDLPWLFKERRDALYDALHRGQLADLEALAVGWLEAALQTSDALELVAATEALAIHLEAHGHISEAATALAIALRLHHQRRHLPFHGTLLRRAAGVLSSLGGLDAAGLLAAEALRLAIESGDEASAAYSLCASFRMASLAKDIPGKLAAIAAARRFLPEGEYLLAFSLTLGEASAAILLGRFAEAEERLDAATLCLAGRQTPATESYLLWAQGRLRQAQGRHEEAAAKLAAASELGRATQEPTNRILILLDLGESLETLGRAADLRERCLQLREELASFEGFECGASVNDAFASLCARVGA